MGPLPDADEIKLRLELGLPLSSEVRWPQDPKLYKVPAQHSKKRRKRRRHG